MTELTLRCFAEHQSDGSWYAHCIDLTLDAQAPEYAEARRKLDDAIVLYLSWASEAGRGGNDLLRLSPLEFRLRYYWAGVRERAFALWTKLQRRRHPARKPEEQFVTHPQLPSPATVSA